MDKKVFNILMVGVGGQGIILAGDIMSAAALNAGLDVKKSEIHGMSQRGGSVFCHVRFGEKVYSPVISEGEADILVSLEKMETLRWLRWSNDKTRFIVLSEEIKPAMTDVYPDGIDEELESKCKDLVLLSPKEIVGKIGDRKYLNVCLLGIVSKFAGFDAECWKRAIWDLAPKGSREDNWKAFEFGRNEFLSE